MENVGMKSFAVGRYWAESEKLKKSFLKSDWIPFSRIVPLSYICRKYDK